MRRFALCLILFAMPLWARPWVALFGSYDCDDCAKIKKEWTQNYSLPEGPVLVFLPIEHQGNYALLSKLEDKLVTGPRGSSFPVFVIGKTIVYDVDKFTDEEETFVELADKEEFIEEELEILHAAQQAKTVLVTLNVTGKNQTAPQMSEPAPAAEHKLAFFQQKNCAKCSRQEKELEILAEKMPTLKISRFDVATLEGLAMLTRFHKTMKIKKSDKNLAPLLCWSNGFITGRLASADELLKELNKPQTLCFWDSPATDQEINAEKLTQNSKLDSAILSSVISSGLADGINPCAFATSVFLISYLLMKKRKKLHIAVIGFSFCTGVFAAYLLFGLGLSFLIDFLNRFSWIKTALYSLFAVISAVLAFGHARDAWKFKKTGKASDMDLGLSKEKHGQIHEKIRNLTLQNMWLAGPAAIVLGAVVSSMELACTGQIYLPVLVAINASGVSMRSFNLLLLYNVCFILPLAAVTVLAACGIGAKSLADWAKRNVFSTKILMAVIFAIIAVIMTAIVILQ